MYLMFYPYFTMSTVCDSVCIWLNCTK